MVGFERVFVIVFFCRFGGVIVVIGSFVFVGIFFNLVQQTINAFMAFTQSFVITNGGPGYASSTFTLYTINAAFKFSNFGLAATMAVAIMFLIVFIYIIQNFLIHRVVLKEGRK